jgi:two-component system KDP operon response regulator KdpE
VLTRESSVLLSWAQAEHLDSGPKTVLIVDDDPEVRLSLGARLCANHYDVIFAADGVTSIAEAREHKPNLILLDLGMPSGDGYAVLEWLQGNKQLSSIPVVVLSGRDRHANRGASLNAGATAYLQKPVENEVLLATIRRVMGQPAVPGMLLAHD